VTEQRNATDCPLVVSKNSSQQLHRPKITRTYNYNKRGPMIPMDAPKRGRRKLIPAVLVLRLVLALLPGIPVPTLRLLLLLLAIPLVPALLLLRWGRRRRERPSILVLLVLLLLLLLRRRRWRARLRTLLLSKLCVGPLHGLCPRLLRLRWGRRRGRRPRAERAAEHPEARVRVGRGRRRRHGRRHGAHRRGREEAARAGQPLVCGRT